MRTKTKFGPDSNGPESLCAQRIKKLRTDLGMSQRYIAAQLDIDFNSVSRWEHGRHLPLKHISKLANILKTNPDYIKGTSDDPSPLLCYVDNSKLYGNKYIPVPIISNDITIPANPEPPLYPQNIIWNSSINFPVKQDSDIRYYIHLLDENKLFAFEAESDAMAPEIQYKDVVIFTNGQQLNQGDIAICYFQEHIILRRVSFLPNDIIHIEAINSQYGDIKLDAKKVKLNKENFYILGRVVLISPQIRRPTPKW